MKVSHWNKYIRYFISAIVFLIGIPIILLEFLGQILQIPSKLLNNFLDDLR